MNTQKFEQILSKADQKMKNVFDNVKGGWNEKKLLSSAEKELSELVCSFGLEILEDYCDKPESEVYQNYYEYFEKADELFESTEKLDAAFKKRLGIKTCPTCGKTLKLNDAFCSDCGTRQDAKELECPNCAAEYEEGQKFCGQCGTKL